MTTKIAAQLTAADQADPEVLRVLLVDDDDSVLRFLVSAFTSNHCQA